MALYEGIALIQEKQAVVLDLGTDYTKFGFTGEAAPRCIVRTEFWCTAERRYKRVYEYKTPEELYDNLVNMLHLLYFRHVLVNPKERKVVVVESLLTPTLFRETLAKVLFTHYEVSGVIWADNPRMCALTLGTPITLIVSVGAREAEVSAVVHACPVLRALQSQPLASHAIHDELARLIDEDNNSELHLSDDIIEDIKVKTCFITTRERSGKWAAGETLQCKSVQYPVPGRAAITISGKTRELAAESLFVRDNELASLPDIILQCIMLCPIDVRRPLAENILVTGGTACMPGLKVRLAQELRHLAWWGISWCRRCWCHKSYVQRCVCKG
ncbi:actin-related protein 10 isoform X2 [Hyposmocoma kahamanoa]|uniref:actin-related protein 10 isoform X2 n=1 Tax=Hyposmocoma kahamanoa TaxID=1477025 RepID=UPI000E6D6025|nr:actin-related protein 10 isoform X2 [Hyposmocoma kahamanoa]